MYQQQINHINRTAIVLVVDCSLSMKKMTSINTMRRPRAEAAALVCNYIIDELLERATRFDTVRNYYDIAAIGYSGEGIVSLLPGDGKGFVAINRLAEMAPQPTTTYVEHRTPEGETIEVPFVLHPWVTPTATGATPMYEALVEVRDMVKAWCEHPDNRDSFPPIVFHITDGTASDASESELIDIAQRITKTSTRDGNTLFINVHLSSTDRTDAFCEVFPSEATFHTDDPERLLLYRMSSVIPQRMEPQIADMLHPIYKGPYRAVAFNTTVYEILSIISIGSESINAIR